MIVQAPKFYLFDVGVAGHVTGRRIDRATGPEFGRAFEHLILMELLAWRSYSGRDDPIRYWRTKSGLECGFALGRRGETAIEVRGTAALRSADLRPIRAYGEEHDPRRAIVVTAETAPRQSADGSDLLPWRYFLDRLWAGELID